MTEKNATYVKAALGIVILLSFGVMIFKYLPPATATQGIASENVAQKVASTTEVASLVPCAIDSTDFECFQNYYTRVVKEKSIPQAFSELKKQYEASQYVQSQCHPLTHVIGHAAATMYTDVSDAFGHGDPLCWSGYYHGVMEEIVERIGIENVTANLDTICSGVKGKEVYSFDYYNCVHGLGHGVMDVARNDLFKSLKLCDSLTGEWEKSSCYSGVFMENVMVDNRGDAGAYLRPSEPLYPCNAVGNSYKSSCYLMQTSYMLKVSGQNFSKVFALCRKADKGFEALCFQSLGRDASGQSISQVEPTKAKCDLGANYEEKANCIVGAVKDFISYYHSDLQAKNLCDALSPDLQKICTDTKISYYQSL